MSALSKLSEMVKKTNPYEGLSPDERKLARLEAFLSAVDDGLTREEFIEAFNIVRQYVEAMADKNIEGFKELKDIIQKTIAQLEDDTSLTLSDVREQVREMIDTHTKTIEKKLKEVKNGDPGPKGDKGDTVEGPPGPPGPPGSPDSPLDIRNKLETLAGKERLSKDAIDGIDELEKAISEKTGNTVRVGWGAHPLQIQGLGVVIDKNTRVINFSGPSLTSVTRTPSGVVNVVIGGGGTGYVGEEVPTDSGDHINFTLAHTPIAGTLRVYRGGARQASIGVTPDYSISGTTLTLSIALNTAAGEVLFVDYQYT